MVAILLPELTLFLLLTTVFCCLYGLSAMSPSFQTTFKFRAGMWQREIKHLIDLSTVHTNSRWLLSLVEYNSATNNK